MRIENFRGEIRQDEPVSSHTSFAVGGPVDIFAFPVDRDDLQVLVRELKKREQRYFILGGGTNLLVRDGGFRGAAISLRRMNALRIEREYRSIGGSSATLFAEAGVFLTRMLAFAAEEGLTGFEFAAGIPGTVGGAIRMNAGTAEGEIGDVVESVGLLTPEGDVITRSREDLGFGYRTSALPDGFVILDARIILRRDDSGKITGRVRELLEHRKQSQPQGFPNAGSLFKNPPGESAGKLIDTAGLKGRTIGGAQVSEKHANFIVNRGNATAGDVLALMELVVKTVLEVHGVRLEPEVVVLGEDF